MNFIYLVLLQRKEMVGGIPIFKNEHIECGGCEKKHSDKFGMSSL
jgi:hypothetical protein